MCVADADGLMPTPSATGAVAEQGARGEQRLPAGGRVFWFLGGSEGFFFGGSGGEPSELETVPPVLPGKPLL